MTTPDHTKTPAEATLLSASGGGDLASCMNVGDRSRGDGCPGAVRMHEATDGYIGRVRFPGGFITAENWGFLAETASTFGDGDIHLTTRGNVQIRGVRDPEGLSAHLAAHGHIPSVAHDKMRNIITDPVDARWAPWAQRLDEALRATQATAGLSGRTLFALDSGRGDAAGFGPDFGLIARIPTTDLRHTADADPASAENVDAAGLADAIDPTHAVDLLCAGHRYETNITLEEAIDRIVAMASAWQAVRGSAWRIKEAPEHHATVLAAVGITDTATGVECPRSTHRPVGWLEATHLPQGHTSLGFGVRFGQVTNTQAGLLAAIGKNTTVSAWPTITIHNLTQDEAEAIVKVGAPHGLVFDSHSRQLLVTACTGRPGCAKSLSDVRSDAQALMAGHPVDADVADHSSRVHFSGCARRCGHPQGAYVDYLATGEGEYDTAAR